jgi:membrane AbrB-like protein
MPPLLIALVPPGEETLFAAPGEPLPWLLAAVLAAGVGVVQVLARIKVGNPWFLGGLACGVVAALLLPERPLVPGWLLSIAQVMMGVALGERFTRDFLLRAPRLALASVATTVLLLVLCAAVGFALAFVDRMPVAAMVLGTAPGGVAEMGLTAKILGLGAPIVTAFQLLRLLAVILISSALLPVFRKLAGVP